MGKLRYLISSPGRFHNFEVAKVLYTRNQLYKIISSYPWIKLKREKIPKNFVDCFGLFSILVFLIQKTKFQAQFLKNMIINLNNLAVKNVDRMASKYVDHTDVFLSMSTTGLNTGKKFREKNKVYICERASAHILEQEKILMEEYKSLNLPPFKIDKWTIKRELEEYKESDIILVPSLFVKRSFEKHLPSLNKVHVLSYGINLQNFYPTQATEKSSDYFDILFIGSLSIQKGLHYLIKAFNQFKHPKKKLHLVGGYNIRDYDFFKNKLKDENFLLYGTVPHLKLRNIINKSNVCILPSIQDGFATVILQALACGCPVIVSENVGAAELVTENKCGFTIPIRNSQAISDKLTLLSDNKNLLNEFSHNALKLTKSITWDDYVNKLNHLILEIKKNKI